MHTRNFRCQAMQKISTSFVICTALQLLRPFTLVGDVVVTKHSTLITASASAQIGLDELTQVEDGESKETPNNVITPEYSASVSASTGVGGRTASSQATVTQRIVLSDSNTLTSFSFEASGNASVSGGESAGAQARQDMILWLDIDEDTPFRIAGNGQRNSNTANPWVLTIRQGSSLGSPELFSVDLNGAFELNGVLPPWPQDYRIDANVYTIATTGEFHPTSASTSLNFELTFSDVSCAPLDGDETCEQDEYLWTGQGATNAWTEGNNWDPNGPPTSDDIAKFVGGVSSHTAELSDDGVATADEVQIGGTNIIRFRSGRLDTDDLNVGVAAGDSPTLRLESNAEIITNNTMLGLVPGAPATMEISNSDLVADLLHIGVDERSELQIGTLSQVTARDVRIASGEGDRSKITISDGGGLGISESLSVGDGEPGTLEIKRTTSGGILTFAGQSAPDTTDFAQEISRGSTATVSGDGSAWQSEMADLEVSAGELRIEDQGKATFRRLTVMPEDVRGLSQVTNRGELTVTDTLTLAGSSSPSESSATLNVSDRSKLIAKDIKLLATADGTAGDDARLSISGTNTTATINGTLTIGDSNTDASGWQAIVVVDDGAQVTFSATGNATEVDKRGVLLVSGEETSYTQMFGDLTVDQGRVLVGESADASFRDIILRGSDNPNTGVLEINNATVTADDDVLVGNVDDEEVTKGVVRLIDGLLFAQNDILVHPGSRIEGTGVVELVSGRRVTLLPADEGLPAGSISPGLSPGTLTINADLDMGHGSVLEIEIGGAEADSEHDLLIVNGDAMIKADVSLTFMNGFAPKTGDTFDFLQVTGEQDLTAAEFTIANLAPDFEFSIDSQDDMVMLTALTDGTYVPPAGTMDLSADGTVDAADADLLVREILADQVNLGFDLNADGVVDTGDLSQFLTDAATENGFDAPYQLGDANLDGQVDTADLNELGIHWRQDGGLWSGGDFDANGVTNAGDLNSLAVNWRQSIVPPAAEAVPEPGTTNLLAVILTLVLASRMRRVISYCHAA